MDLSLTARRFRSASRRRSAAAVLWMALILAGIIPRLLLSELWLSWALLGSAWFLRCVEWRTARNGRFTREWVGKAWQEALRLREQRLAIERRPAPMVTSQVASREWLEEVNQALPPVVNGEIRAVDMQLERLTRREMGILDLRRVTMEFRAEAWLTGLLGLTCALAGLAGWTRGGGALAGFGLLMMASYLSHTAKATALGGP